MNKYEAKLLEVENEALSFYCDKLKEVVNEAIDTIENLDKDNDEVREYVDTLAAQVKERDEIILQLRCTIADIRGKEYDDAESKF